MRVLDREKEKKKGEWEKKVMTERERGEAERNIYKPREKELMKEKGREKRYI